MMLETTTYVYNIHTVYAMDIITCVRNDGIRGVKTERKLDKSKFEYSIRTLIHVEYPLDDSENIICTIPAHTATRKQYADVGYAYSSDRSYICMKLYAYQQCR